jgi:hypothetical protein
MAWLGNNTGARTPLLGGLGNGRRQFEPIRPVCSAYSNTAAALRMRLNLNASEAKWVPPPQGSETNPDPPAGGFKGYFMGPVEFIMSGGVT